MTASKPDASVGDYVTLVRGTTYKGSLVGKPGPALLGLGSISPGGGFRIGHYKTYGGDCPANLMLAPGDLYASLKGATKDGKMIGSVARVPPSVSSGRLTQDTVKLVFRRPNQPDVSYLYWILRTPQYREYCAGHAMGSAVVALSRRDFLEYPVPPPTSRRRTIVALLDEIEDKIELNRRMNETMEAMARALFKSWFVDFDPVRAKANGRLPSVPRNLAGLFPDSFADSELGGIPNGWKIERLSNVMTFEGGSQPPASEFISEPRDGYVRLVQIRDFYSNSHVTFVPDVPKLRKFSSDDIMIARYGSSGNSEKTKDSLARICRGLSGAYNVALVKVVPLRPYREFLGCFLRSSDFQSAIKGMGARSVQSGFRKEDLDVISIVTAPPALHEAFEKFAEAVWHWSRSAHNESDTLAALRDALLLKLISGELRVKDAERLVEHVV